MRFVYVAEPIDQAAAGVTEATRFACRSDAVSLLNDRGVGVYWPSMAFSVHGVAVGPEVSSINNHALDQCTGLLAFLPAGAVSVGVPMEIDRAIFNGVPVAVVTDLVKSWALALEARNLRLFDNHNDAVEWLATHDNVVTKNGHLPLPFRRQYTDETNSEQTVLPTRGYADDAGLDLYVSRATEIKPGTFVDVPTNVACGFPPGVWGLIIGRSSTLRQRGLMVNQGVIDPGYRGPLFAGAWNLSQETVKVEVGDRIAQMILLPSLSQYQPTWVDTLPPSHDGRGGAGFGSTG